MKKNPLLIKTFLIFFILNLVPLPTNAQGGQQNTGLMVNFLFDYAKKLYQRGDFLNARHEFNTLLVIDPDNAMARHYLKNMGPVRELPRVSEKRRPEGELRIRPEAGLREENRWLRAAVSQFREEIVDKSMRIASLKRAMGAGAKDETAARERQIERALSDAEHFVSRINEYAREVRLLKSKLAITQEGQRVIQAGEGDTRKEARLAESAAMVTALRAALQEKEIEVAGLRMREGVKAPELKEENLQLQGVVSKFREEIIERGIRITELQQKLEEKDAERNLQQARLAEFAGRLQGFRAAFQAKEIEAAEKEQQLASIRKHLKRLEDENMDKSRQIAQLQAFKDLELADFKARMAEARDLLQAQEMEIAVLNKESRMHQEDMDRRLLDKELELAAKYTEIEKLNTRLNDTNLQLEQAKKEKLDSELWIEQLVNTVKQLEEASSDQLAKYLKKLNSVEDSLKAREDELGRLNTDFDSRSQKLQEQLSAKSSEAEKLNAKINDCHKKLVILENSLKIKDRELAELKEAFNTRR